MSTIPKGRGVSLHIANPLSHNHNKNMFKNTIGSSVLRAHRHMLSKRFPLRYTSYCSLHLSSHLHTYHTHLLSLILVFFFRTIIRCHSTPPKQDLTTEHAREIKRIVNEEIDNRINQHQAVEEELRIKFEKDLNEREKYALIDTATMFIQLGVFGILCYMVGFNSNQQLWLKRTEDKTRTHEHIQL